MIHALANVATKTSPFPKRNKLLVPKTKVLRDFCVIHENAGICQRQLVVDILKAIPGLVFVVTWFCLAARMETVAVE
jgi:hypothetical protein